MRDYIHVMDLAEGHVAALDKLFRTPSLGCVPINLGTGTGSTVLEMIKAVCVLSQHVPGACCTHDCSDPGSLRLSCQSGLPVGLSLVRCRAIRETTSVCTWGIHCDSN